MKPFQYLMIILVGMVGCQTIKDNPIQNEFFNIEIEHIGNVTCSMIVLGGFENFTDEQKQGVIWSMLETSDYIIRNESGLSIVTPVDHDYYSCPAFINKTRTYKSINDIPTENDCIDEKGNCWIKFEPIDEIK